ncbi:MAG: hypothetical protein FWE41_05045 [Coriobacteriia bacterium]|nr:hypothetical protein [Coriobacteriia bacterium]MCL2749787.1 hypothetical protein [Coriobacteriia bacterium]
MNPCIIIPTYVGSKRHRENTDVLTIYDHVTPLTHQGELPRCLQSLVDVGIECPIFVLVVAEQGVEAAASNKIAEILSVFTEQLDLRMIDHEVLNRLNLRIDALGVSSLKEGAGLAGYGAIRNLGLLIAAVGNFTECIFIDDDETVDDPEFIDKAVYGLGKLTKTGVPVLVKTGYFTDKKGQWKSSQKSAWYNHFWRQGELFNAWITKAMKGARLSRSNGLYGGLCAIHREAFLRVSFDPWIPRGEDLDYLLNVRMYGGDVWFDNQWHIRHAPPPTRNESLRFRQDIYRWIYEHRKLEFAKSQIDLIQIAPHSLDPYPGPFLEHSIGRRVFLTAILRMIGRASDRKGYFRAALSAQREAKAYAESFCDRYYEFQIGWPQVVNILASDPLSASILGGIVMEPLQGELEEETAQAFNCAE